MRSPAGFRAVGRWTLALLACSLSMSACRGTPVDPARSVGTHLGHELGPVAEGLHLGMRFRDLHAKRPALVWGESTPLAWEGVNGDTLRFVLDELPRRARSAQARAAGTHEFAGDEQLLAVELWQRVADSTAADSALAVAARRLDSPRCYRYRHGQSSVKAAIRTVGDVVSGTLVYSAVEDEALSLPPTVRTFVSLDPGLIIAPGLTPTEVECHR